MAPALRSVALLGGFGLALLAAGCDRSAAAQVGDRGEGKTIIDRQQCGSCHIIPGIISADGQAGPTLAQFSQHSTIAGVLPNTPENLVAWLQHPQSYAPGNAMPDMGLSERDARNIAAYLYSAR